MRRPAAIEAAPSPEKIGECSPHDQATILCCCKGSGVLKREICAGQSTGAVQTAPLLATTDEFLVYSSTQSDEGRAPWATGSTEVIDVALTGISVMLFVCFLLSVVCLAV